MLWFINKCNKGMASIPFESVRRITITTHAGNKTQFGKNKTMSPYVLPINVNIHVIIKIWCWHSHDKDWIVKQQEMYIRNIFQRNRRTNVHVVAGRPENAWSFWSKFCYKRCLGTRNNALIMSWSRHKSWARRKYGKWKDTKEGQRYDFSEGKVTEVGHDKDNEML